VTVLSAKFVHCSRASKWAMELSPRFNAGSPTSFEVLLRNLNREQGELGGD